MNIMIIMMLKKSTLNKYIYIFELIYYKKKYINVNKNILYLFKFFFSLCIIKHFNMTSLPISRAMVSGF